jgi:hypothetical protein
MRHRLVSCCWLSGVPLSFAAVLFLSACAGLTPTGYDGAGSGKLPLGVQLSAVESPQAAALRVAPRVALVIGNNAYRGELSPLMTSQQDARRIAEVLRQSGFQLIGGSAQLDVNRARFAQLVAQTEQTVRQNPGAVVVVYFSGHGYARQGHNYLAPVDLSADHLDDPASAESGSIIGLAQGLSAAGAGLNIMFVDACRNAQFGEAGGLSDEKTPDNTFIGFAAPFGAVALESGGGANSYYTAALLKVWNRSFDRLEDMHTAVAVETLQSTAGQQTPVYREGMLPVVPVRLGSTDPQSVFARYGSGSGAAISPGNLSQLDARCAAMSDIRILAGIVPVQSNGRLPAVPGPRGQAVDLQNAKSACAASLAAGAHSPATLRGAALIDLLSSSGSGFSGERRSQDAALLTQAAEQGDPAAEFLLAILNANGALSASNADKQTLVGDRFERVEQANLPMISAWMALIRLNLGGQNQQLQDLTNLTTQPKRAMDVLHRQAELGDQTALVELYFLYVERPEMRPSIDGQWLRNCIRRAISAGVPSVGMELGGLTPYQSLYLVTIFDYGTSTLGPLNVGEFTEVLFATEPFFGKLNATFSAAFPSINFVGMLACRTVMGLDTDARPAPGGVPHREANLRFLERVAPYSGRAAQGYVTILRHGFPLTCPG